MALRLLSDLVAARLRPSVVTFNSTISACLRTWQAALQVLMLMDTWSTVPDTITYNSTISALSRGECWQHSLAMLQHIASRDLQLNVISYSSAMASFEVGGRWESSPRPVFEDVCINSAPKRSQWQHPHQRLCGSRPWQIVLSLHASMHSVAVPSIVSSNSAMSACLASFHWRDAMQLHAGMPDARVRPDVLSHSSAVMACERALLHKAAAKVLEQLHNCTYCLCESR